MSFSSLAGSNRPGLSSARRRFRIGLGAAASVIGVMVISSPSLQAETFVTTGGTKNWIDTTSWLEGTVPNSVGATAIFNSPTANTSASLAGSTALGGITVGSITFNNTTSTTIGIFNGTGGGPLKFDAVDAGPATITTTGTGTGNNTISATMEFIDSVTATVNNTAATSAAGSLNLTGAISGPGGITKAGPGTLTLSTGAKTYSGPTLVSEGRLRISTSGTPTNTSSVTVANGGQIVFTAVSTTTPFTFGPGSLNLNGTGLAAFPGALRVDQPSTVITNPVVLQTDASINVPGTANSLRLTGVVSGPGQLEVGTLPGDPTNQGQLILTGDNTYTGGTRIVQGTVVVSGASADLGSGNVTVDGVSTGPGGSVANGKLTIQTGVLNAIDDLATLTLTGGAGAGAADGGFVTLEAGVNEAVGGLVLGGAVQGLGTYGSTSSLADFKSDEFFAGTGIVTVVPEPGAMSMLLGGFGALLSFQRLRRRS